MEWNPQEDAFEGGVLSQAIEGRRSAAELVCTASALRATARDGRTFEIPYQGMELELGGATGKMLFCRDRERTLTIFSEAKGFPVALRSASRGLLDRSFDELGAARSQRRRGVWIGIFLFLALAVGIIYAARPLIRTAVGSLLPYSVDEAIGKAAHAHMSKGGPEVSDELVLRSVRAIIERLQPFAALPGATFEVDVIRNDIVNAYALPGGYLVVFTELLERANRPEEVAGVLAHEMAHVTLRHGMQRMVQASAVVVVVTALFGDVSGLVGLAVEFFTWQSINSYSRGSEEEADREGVRMLHAAGIDPRGLVDFFTRLSQEEGARPNVPSWLGSHPSHDRRVEALKDQIEGFGGIQYDSLDIDWESVRARLHGLGE